MPGGFDPFDPGQAQRAWPLLKELRREGPVAPIAGGMHYVTRHAECREVLRDTEAFSNASGMKAPGRSEEHTSELQSHVNLVCRLLLEKKTKTGRGCTRKENEEHMKIR